MIVIPEKTIEPPATAPSCGSAEGQADNAVPKTEKRRRLLARADDGIRNGAPQFGRRHANARPFEGPRSPATVGKQVYNPLKVLETLPNRLRCTPIGGSDVAAGRQNRRTRLNCHPFPRFTAELSEAWEPSSRIN